MINRIWYGHSRLYLLLLPFSWFYGLVSAIRRFAYRVGWLKSWRAPIPVVVIGNLTVGGSGKTPMVIWLVEQLQQRGIRVGVVSRGYGGKSAYYPLVLTSSTSVQQAGDESVVIFQRTGVAIAIAPKRCEAVRALLAQHDLEIIITDDGLQHYGLARDFEIIVIDGVRRFGNGWWLPAGPMRERTGRLKWADAIVINGGEAQGNEIPMVLKGAALINLVTGEQRPGSFFTNAVAMAGIGYPTRFFATLKQLGVRVVQEVSYRDHQHYLSNNLNALTPLGQPLLMTEKDAVKCRQFAQENWWYLPINADIASHTAANVLDKIAALLDKS